MDFVTKHKLRDLVISSLQSLNHIRVKEREILILCPWHRDGSPSLGVSTDITCPGIFHCFTCKAKGSWNDLAAKLGFPLVDYKEAGRLTEHDDPFGMLSRILGEETKKSMAPLHYLNGTEDLPLRFSWRGMNRKFLMSLGGKYFWEKKTSDEYLYLPITMHAQYRGYTICKLNRSGAKGELKYLTFSDTKESFLGYDQVPEDDSIVLCEGHADALSLLYKGLPALCIFGVANWGPTKKAALLAKRPKKVVICFDGDKPGWDASLQLFMDLRDCLDVDIFYLPILNKDEKLDPANMPDEYVEELRRRTLA